MSWRFVGFPPIADIGDPIVLCRMMRQFLPTALALLLLSACSYHYELRAIERDGQLIFEPTEDGGHGCLSNLTVKSQDGEIMWEADAGRYRRGEGRCPSSFPVVYGVPPHGLPQKAPAKPLKAGVVYKIIAWDGDSYTGAFKFRTGIVVENLQLPAGAFAED